MIRNLAQLETDIQSLMGMFFRPSKPNVPRGKEKPSKQKDLWVDQPMMSFTLQTNSLRN